MKLSVHMLVLNAAGVIERALRSVADAADEICIVDTGSGDGTPDIARRLANELGLGFQCVLLHPSTHPGLYFRDEPSSWRSNMPGPFTGLPILRDWAEARNLGLAGCHGDWILKLDADDECMEPGGLVAAIQQLARRPAIDHLVCPYEIMSGPEITMITYQDRMWRNKPSTRFHFPLHERLIGRGTSPDGKANWLLSAAGLSFRDWRDSTGLGVRIAHRNFKVLLAARERLLDQGRDLEPTSLLDLGHEAIGVDPAYALEALGKVHDVFNRDPEWHMNAARAHLALGDEEAARLSYLVAIEAHPRMAAPRLALGLLELGMGRATWRETLETAIKMADEGARFDVFLPDLARARKLLETDS
jgi:glycosyltransferase involved in cell wall biosynthesis